jgi:hypothetical protein
MSPPVETGRQWIKVEFWLGCGALSSDVSVSSHVLWNSYWRWSSPSDKRCQWIRKPHFVGSFATNYSSVPHSIVTSDHRIKIMITAKWFWIKFDSREFCRNSLKLYSFDYKRVKVKTSYLHEGLLVFTPTCRSISFGANAFAAGILVKNKIRIYVFAVWTMHFLTVSKRPTNASLIQYTGA